MKEQFEVRIPFFAPMWRRVLAVAALGGWTLVELALSNPIWALVFGAATAWLAWSFFVAWRDPE